MHPPGCGQHPMDMGASAESKINALNQSLTLDTMNMGSTPWWIWTTVGALSNFTPTQTKRCSHDQVQHDQIRRYRPCSRDRGRCAGVCGKRPEPAGEDGLPRRCRIVLLAIRRQAVADAGLPRAEQGKDLHALPPGRAST